MTFKSTSASSASSPPPLFGQRTLPARLFSKTSRSNNVESANVVTSEQTTRKQRISLSDFLSRKLGDATPSRGGGSPSLFREKASCFSSVVPGSNAAVGIIRRYDDDEANRLSGGGKVASFVIDGSIQRESHQTSVAVKESGGIQEKTWKRKRTFSVEDRRPPPRKHLIVLGDDPKPKQRGITRENTTQWKRGAVFNHYSNGNGWWDCVREGIDNEEVGCEETWEGLGSTTLGGLSWN